MVQTLFVMQIFDTGVSIGIIINHINYFAI